MSDSAEIITYLGFALTILSVVGLTWSLRSSHGDKEEFRGRLEHIKAAVDSNVAGVRILNGATRALADRIIRIETRLAAQDIETRAALGTMPGLTGAGPAMTGVTQGAAPTMSGRFTGAMPTIPGVTPGQGDTPDATLKAMLGVTGPSHY